MTVRMRHVILNPFVFPIFTRPVTPHQPEHTPHRRYHCSQNLFSTDDTTPVTIMQSIDTLSHATSNVNAASIRQSGSLNHGTWFLCSLPGGRLQTWSPFGDNFLRVPIATVLKQFTSPELYFQNKYENYNGTRHSYYNLSLFEKGSSFPWYYKKLDMRNNEYLVIDTANQNYTVKTFTNAFGGGNYVALCIEKKIDIPCAEQIWFPVAK